MKRTIFYLLLFITLQFLTYYPTVIVWLWVSGMPFSRATMLALHGQALVSTPMVITTQLLFSILLIAVFLWRRYCEVSPGWLRSQGWIVLVWSAIVGIGTIIPSQALQEHLPPLPDMLRQTMMGVMNSPLGYLCIAILAPLSEEIVFRGAIERQLLTSVRPFWAIVISAVLFALVHVNPAQMPHAFIIGLILGWMYYRTGSILPGLALHWANNTVAYLVIRLAPQYADANLTDIFGSQQRVIMAIAFSLLIIIPAILQLHLNMRRENSH